MVQGSLDQNGTGPGAQLSQCTPYATAPGADEMSDKICRNDSVLILGERPQHFLAHRRPLDLIDIATRMGRGSPTDHKR